MEQNRTATVFGAYGHTGRFIVAELRNRGWTPILSGRDPERLAALGAHRFEQELRPASVDDPASLDRALHGTAAVIDCAGPFAATAGPVMEAALRARVPYLDVTAEVEVVSEAFEQYGARARAAGIAIVPAIGFYGGLGDLLATAAMDDWSAADEIRLAYALSSWKPTYGTRATIQTSKQRRGGRRLVYANQRLEYRIEPAPVLDWHFPAPVGTQTVVGEFLTADSVTIGRHLQASEICTYMTAAPLKDLSDPDLSPPPAIDASGRSSQTFLLEAVVRSGSAERRAVATGQDIYAITAPLVVEAMERIVRAGNTTRRRRGGRSLLDARSFLTSLAPAHLSLSLDLRSPRPAR